MTTVEADDLPALHSFVQGLRLDLDAAVAGLTLPYSNGPMEGANTKVKLPKRQMHGRAGFPYCANGSCSPGSRPRHPSGWPAGAGAADGTLVVGFWLEPDTGSMPVTRLVATLDAYRRLQQPGGPSAPAESTEKDHQLGR